MEDGERQKLLDALRRHLPTQSFTNRGAFDKALTKALKGAEIKIGAAVKKAILSALSEYANRPPLSAQIRPKRRPIVRPIVRPAINSSRIILT
jgi:hypothetical protein